MPKRGIIDVVLKEETSEELLKQNPPKRVRTLKRKKIFDPSEAAVTLETSSPVKSKPKAPINTAILVPALKKKRGRPRKDVIPDPSDDDLSESDSMVPVVMAAENGKKPTAQSIEEKNKIEKTEDSDESLEDGEFSGQQNFSSLMENMNYMSPKREEVGWIPIDDVLPKFSRLTPDIQERMETEFPIIKKGTHKKEDTSFMSITSAKSSSKHDVVIFPVIDLQHNLNIVCLKHPASMTLYGYVHVHVLSGEVNILGYDLRSPSKIKVYSTEHTGLLTVHTNESTTILKETKLRSQLGTFTIGDNTVEKVIKRCLPNTTVVLVQNLELPPPLLFLQLYLPHALHIRDMDRKKILPGQIVVAGEAENAINFTDDSAVEDIMEYISNKLDDSKLRIMVYGNKDTGKSTLLRYLVNSILSKCQSVMYLDTDLGQSEFTPPSVLSLTKVKEPLLGPPFSHQQNPERMIFTGSITPKGSPVMYLNSVSKLVDYFESHHPTDVLVVNTMGWTRGLGKEMLAEVIQTVVPTIMIELVDKKKASAKSELEAQMTLNNIAYFKLSQNSAQESYFSHKDLRNFAMMSYLGKCQKYYMQPTYLNSFRPFCVCWEEIAIHFVGEKLQGFKLIAAINASVVALCRVDKSLISANKPIGMPRELTKPDPHNLCVGFGVVRAIDEKNCLLYIVSPLKLEELRVVNCIIRGDLDLPPSVFLNQPIYNTALPYTVKPEGVASLYRKKMKRNPFKFGKKFQSTPL